MEEKYGSGRRQAFSASTNKENSVINDTGYVGVFEHVEDAIQAAKASQKQLMELNMKKRKVVWAPRFGKIKKHTLKTLLCSIRIK